MKLPFKAVDALFHTYDVLREEAYREYEGLIRDYPDLSSGSTRQKRLRRLCLEIVLRNHGLSAKYIRSRGFSVLELRAENGWYVNPSIDATNPQRPPQIHLGREDELVSSLLV